MKAEALLDQRKEEIYALGDRLFRTPELGYKEFETKKILTKLFEDNGLKVKDLGYETAFSVTIGEGYPHIGLIAELDALPTLGHPFASKIDNAAHSCGHSTQCTIMASVLLALKETIKKGSVTLYFTPAEEFTDIDYRKKLMKEKKIQYIGGKINMLTGGCFDEADMIIHLHTMGQGKYHFSLNTSLAGFIYKEITFRGRAAHAAVLPHRGINALNAFVLFDNAMNMLRETFQEKDFIRIHGWIKEGGQTINSIPERVVYECYVRSMNEEALIEAAEKVDTAARHAAMAIGAKAVIKNTPGYLPMVQCREINEIIKKNMLKYCGIEDINDDEISQAAGDIGDVSIFKPAVQFGYSGFAGNCHGKDLCIVDNNRAYLEPAKVVASTVEYLLSHPDFCHKITDNFKPRMTMEEYLKYQNS